MKKASTSGMLVTTIFYLCCGCFGYAAFRDDTPGNLLTGFGFYEPYWLVDFTNACIAAHLIGGYQGDANYLRYHGLQEFDQGMQHLEENYGVALDSDDPLFGGYSRIDHSAEYFTIDGWYDDRPRSLLIYAPSRTAVVYALVDDEPAPAVGLKKKSSLSSSEA